jgi:hypothetical protein
VDPSNPSSPAGSERRSPPLRRHLIVDSPIRATSALVSSTPSYNVVPWTSPAQRTSTLPPPPLLTVASGIARPKPPPHCRPAATVSYHHPLLAWCVLLLMIELLPSKLEHLIAGVTVSCHVCAARNDRPHARSTTPVGMGHAGHFSFWPRKQY